MTDGNISAYLRCGAQLDRSLAAHATAEARLEYEHGDTLAALFDAGGALDRLAAALAEVDALAAKLGHHEGNRRPGSLPGFDLCEDIRHRIVKACGKGKRTELGLTRADIDLMQRDIEEALIAHLEG